MNETKTIGFAEKFLMCFVYTLSIVSLSIVSIAEIPMPPAFFGADKFAHFVAYGVYSVLLLWAIEVWRRPRGRIVLLFAIMLYVGFLGAFMEYLQGTIGKAAGRTFSHADMIANFLGAILCAPVFYKYRIEKFKNETT